MVTEKDLLSDKPFDDTIAAFPDLDRGEASLKHPLTYIPYRSLLPKGVENMLVACRAFSFDETVNNLFNPIPHCIAFGEAAGIASALLLKLNVTVRNVNYESLYKRLVAQNVLLPDNMGNNPYKGDIAAFLNISPQFGRERSPFKPISH